MVGTCKKFTFTFVPVVSHSNNSRVHTAGCKSTYHRWQVPPGGAPVVSGGENAAGCNLPPTKLDLPPTFYL